MAILIGRRPNAPSWGPAKVTDGFISKQPPKISLGPPLTDRLAPGPSEDSTLHQPSPPW